MKFKIKKDLFLKKSTWVVLGIFAITLVNIPRFKTQATGTKDSLNFEPDTLKILEIVPGDAYSLLNGNDVAETELKGQKIQVTHMNMSKFISTVDDITGEYDVVALTNEKSNNMAADGNYWVDRTYRTYTSPFKQEMGHAAYTNDNGYKDGYSEYYPENDITYKRGKLIVDMINKGQLVYVDNTATQVSGTKLNAIFTGNGSSDNGTKINNLQASNLKIVSGDNITLDKIVDDFKALSTDNKRVKVAAAKGPKSESTNSDGTVTNERTLNFSVEANAELNEELTFNVYLDFDGDGLFTGKPYETFKRTGKADYDTYNFSVEINNGFIGYLGWKVEVVRPNGVKTNIQSYATYHAQKGKKDIRVLQIYPNDDKCTFFDNINKRPGTGITKLTDNSTFMDMLSSLQDYNVTIDNISASEFSNQYGNTKTLKNNYDMVIVGFSDSYSNADITTDTALADLDAFIADGKSVMFTHDTIGLGVLGESSGPTKFAQHYKDIVGQSRYKDYFRNGETTNLYTNKYDDGTSEKTSIPHDSSNGIKTLGQTALATSGDSNTWISTQSNQIKNINDAQITTYPYDLRNYNNGTGTLNVSLTHTQWFQLNLEDPDVVPWYNLVSNSAVAGKFNGYLDSNDSRNFYYTYSKGNITYSGTAHSGVATSQQELELFVNTIIKAERGGNAAPTVKNYTDSSLSDENFVENGSTVKDKINTDNDYAFYTLPEDADGDKVTVKVTVNGTVLDNSAIEIAETGATYDGGRINSDTKLKVTIPSSVYNAVPKGTGIPVEVTAVDPLKKEGKSSFNLLSDGNQAPDITNMKGDTIIDDNQELNAPRTSEYTFTTIPADPDDEDKDNLTVSVKVDGQDIATVKDEKGNEVKADTKVSKDSKLSVTIPEDYLLGKQTGDKITVETTVNDNHTAVNEPNGKSATKKFVIVIDAETPHVNLSIVNTVDDKGAFVYNATTFDKDGKEVGTTVLNENTVFTSTTSLFDGSKIWIVYGRDPILLKANTINIAGKITNVYDNSGTISLDIPEYEQVQGNVTVQRIVDGKLAQASWNMTPSTDGKKYTLDLASVNPISLGAVEKEGMQFVVRYSVVINNQNDPGLQNAVKNPETQTLLGETQKKVVVDGNKIITTITTPKTIIKTYDYSSIHINKLSFNNIERTINVSTRFYKKDKNDGEPDRSEKVDIIPDPKNYGYPNLF